MTLLPCSESTAPECNPIEPDCPTHTIQVCCCTYTGNTKEEAVYAAWQATGIPPHKLRYYAETPSFTEIYYI